MIKNKIVILVVDGQSEENLFVYLEERYENLNLHFKVVGGDDFTCQDTDKFKDKLLGYINKKISVYKFKWSDILCIIQITDTDGAFISESDVVVDTSIVNATEYSGNAILVKNETIKSQIIVRNKRKRENTQQLMLDDNFAFKKMQIPYRIFYFSRCLEHVIFNNANPNKMQKPKQVELFVDDKGPMLVNELQDYLPPLTNTDGTGQYQESWEFILREQNSLKRFSNVALIVDFIDELILQVAN